MRKQYTTLFHKRGSCICAGLELQGVDLFVKGADPVLLQDFCRLFGFIHATNDYGLPAFSSA